MLPTIEEIDVEKELLSQVKRHRWWLGISRVVTVKEPEPYDSSTRFFMVEKVTQPLIEDFRWEINDLGTKNPQIEVSESYYALRRKAKDTPTSPSLLRQSARSFRRPGVPGPYQRPSRRAFLPNKSGQIRRQP